MNRLHKLSIGILALTAAGLTVWTAAAKLAPTAPAGQSEQALSPAPVPSAGAGAPVAMEPAVAAPADAPDLTPKAEPAIPVEVPSDLKVQVRTTAKGPVVSVERRNHLVAVRRGSERKVALNKVEWPAKAGEKLALPFETTSTRSLDTTRGQLGWAGEGTSVEVRDTVLPAVVTSETNREHVCRGLDDGAGGFVVVCQVSALAAAASVESKDPGEGVWSQIGDKTLVRFDLPMGEEGTDTKMIGYEKGGQGVVVRVEASRVEGEKTALLAIGSDGRGQPRPVPRFGCFCRLPIGPRLD